MNIAQQMRQISEEYEHKKEFSSLLKVIEDYAKRGHFMVKVCYLTDKEVAFLIQNGFQVGYTDDKNTRFINWGQRN